MRTRIAPMIVIGLLIASGVNAETVMLFLREAPDSSYFDLVGIEYAAAIEDGIMDVFFDAGHIIFNFGLPQGPVGELPFAAEPVAVRTAKSGGATLLIEVELGNPAGSSLVPATAKYTYSDVVRDRLIETGTIRLEEFDRGEITDARELCVAIGRAIAHAALGG